MAINAINLPALFINTQFTIGSWKVDVLGFLDCGNTYLSAISDKFLDQLQIPRYDLIPVSTQAVRQAGAGATLRVLGRLPQKYNNFFKIKGLQTEFPIDDIVVLENLHQDFNISLPFLQSHEFILDLKDSELKYVENGIKVNIPFVHPAKPTVSCTTIRPKLSEEVSIKPHQTITVQSDLAIANGYVAPRISKMKSDNDFIDKQNAVQNWAISEGPTYQKNSFDITNLSNVEKNIDSKFVIGHLCTIVLPNKQELSISSAMQSADFKTIKQKVLIEQKFEKLFLDKLHLLLWRLREVISFNDDPGKTSLGVTYIMTGNAKPVFCPPNRLSPDVEQLVLKQVEQWLRDDIIEEIDDKGSSWNSRLLIIPKKKVPGEPQRYRVCVDLRALNRACQTNLSPFAPFSIQETFHMLGQSKVFSTIDLTHAFMSILIHKPHRHKTAFSLNGRRYFFKRTCFGLSSAPAALGQVMAKALSKVPRSFCLYYMDDVIVFSKSSDDHLRHLKIVLSALLQAGLKIFLAKCKFFRTSLEFLGHLITTEGYTLIKEFLDPVLQWPMIQSKYDVQAFVGCVNYYSDFIKHYSAKARPLFDVLSRPGADDDIQEFTETETTEIKNSMDSLKQALTSAPILAFADFSENSSRFILDCDYSARHHTIGSVLSQIQPPGSGKERVLMYGAKSLRRAKKAYSAYHGELFSSCYFMNKYAFFLQLRHFILRIDNNALKYLQTQKNVPTQIILRFLQTLSEFSFTVVHRTRDLHTNADGMSRCPNAPPVSDSEDEFDSKGLSALTDQTATQLQCPFCAAQFKDNERFDYHIDTKHVSLTAMPFEKWQKEKKSRKPNLESLYLADSTALALAKKPIRLAKFDSDPAKVNPDNSITYSIQQWVAFQRLDPPLRLAIDKHNNVPLTEPLQSGSVKYVKDGFVDAHGMLRYRFLPPNHSTFRELAVVPFALHIPVLKFFHLKAGCASKVETIRLAKQYVYFHNMSQAYESMLETCDPCQRRNKALPPNKFQLISHRYVEPFFCIALDHVGRLVPPQNGHNYLLTLRDCFSGWPEMFPVPTTEAKYVIDILANQIFCRFGLPHILLTDSHSCFVGKEFSRFCKELGIELRHSIPHNPRSNFAERSHVDLKRKTNSFLRQTESNEEGKFKCYLCGDISPSRYRLEKHLDQHNDPDLYEAIQAPKKQALRLLEEERLLRGQKHFQWLQCLPSVLWAMRTQVSEARGLSPFNILFGKNPNSSLDNLYGHLIRQDEFQGSAAEFIRARTRRDELANTFAKHNIARQINRQRSYYVAHRRVFEVGSYVYVFTPTSSDEVSTKWSTFWSGPYSVESKVGETAYRVRPVKGKFGGSHKPMTVQVDRLKPFKEQDPVITPPPNFTGEVLEADPHVEEYIHVPSKVSNDIKRESNIKDKDIIEDLYSKQIPPWESHLPDSTPTSKEEEKVITNPKKISLKDYKPGPPRPVHKKYAGLPAPPLTRARARAQAESSTVIASMSSEPPIEDSYLVDRHTSGYVQYWDDFFHRRLEIDLFPCPTWTLHSIS